MTTLLRPYFDTEGPCGLPMKDRQAKALESRLKDLPKDDAYALRRCSVERGVTEVLPEGRCEVSWITAEAPDRVGDVVLASGMDDSHYRLNPIVTLNHAYDQPPVGRSLWRRRVREGTLAGVKAKTVYPPRPATWDDAWPPDRAFELIQAGLLCGKSIGFFPLKLRPPTPKESELPGYQNVRYVIEEWLLAEYACCVLPMQPHAVVAEVCKQADGAETWSRLPACSGAGQAGSLPHDGPIFFTTLDDIAKSLPARLLSADFIRRLEKALQRSWEKTRGRV
jgi:hypothetical protein